MKARIKGTTEWKEYKAVFGPEGSFIGLETEGYSQTDEEWCKENGIEYDPTSPFNGGMHYVSAIMPLDAFDLYEETDWDAFRRETAKDVLCVIIQKNGVADIENALEITDSLIAKLKEKE